MYTYRAIVVKVIDGDTIDVDIDLGFYTVLKNQRIRFYGIDTPEVRTKNLIEKARGMSAKAFVEKLLPAGKECILMTHKDEKEKFGRYLGTIIVDGANLSDLLIAEGHAKPYIL